jgi:hypothetical protein
MSSLSRGKLYYSTRKRNRSRNNLAKAAVEDAAPEPAALHGSVD